MSKVSKMFILMAVVACAMLMLAGVASAAKIMKMGTSTQPDHIYNKGVELFEKLVEEGTKGAIDVQLFPAAQLGAERELVEGMQLGTVQGTMTSTGPMGNFLPDIKLFNLPFLFKDREAAYKVLDGPVGTKIADKLLKVGIRSLGWAENGFRNITNSRNAVEKPEDVKGLKIRVMEDDLFIISMKALGASPLPWPLASSTPRWSRRPWTPGKPPGRHLLLRFFEVQKYLAMTGHFYSPAMLLVSESFFSSLSDDEKKVVLEAGKKACAYERELSLKADQELEAACKKAGMVITHPDKAPFQEQVAGVYTNPVALKAIGGGDAKVGEALIKSALEAAK